MITVEKVLTREGFSGLASVWNPLLRESASDTLFLTHEWLSVWWEVFGGKRELYILLVRDGEELIGIAPLLRKEVRHYGLLPFRRLEFLASGEDQADEVCSEYLDFILRRGRELEALEHVFRTLRANSAEWDELLLTNVSADSTNLALLEKICEAAGINSSVLHKQNSSYLTLDTDFESYLARLGKKFQSNLRRERRVAEKHGGHLRIIDSIDGFEENFETLISLHQACWTERGEPGVFASERFTRFHKAVAPVILRNGWLRLYVYLLGDEAVSALYAFAYNQKLFYYQSGFAGRRAPLYSPGTLIQSHAIEDAVKSGFREFDFLTGEEHGYKAKWGAQQREVLQLRLAQSQSKEVVYKTTTKLVAGLRHFKRSLASKSKAS
ncbi:MAG TPA: GNAT family N-acetyltransferase [Pyrinomonadaceae bacterium]